VRNRLTIRALYDTDYESEADGEDFSPPSPERSSDASTDAEADTAATGMETTLNDARYDCTYIIL